jgi:uncharacterized protein (TIGR03118 family)
MGAATATLAALTTVPGAAAAPIDPHRYRQTNLVSDLAAIPGHSRPLLLDPDLQDPWGIAAGPQTPLWVANRRTNTSTLYSGFVGKQKLTKQPLVVDVSSEPSGIIYNPANNFPVTDGTARGSSRFVFGALNGTVSGWSPAVPPPPPSTRAQPVITLPGPPGQQTARITGLALARTKTLTRLFVADSLGQVLALDGLFRPVALAANAFEDPLLGDMGAYGIAVLGGRVFVAFAPRAGTTTGPLGAIDVFSLGGGLVQRLVKPRVGNRLTDPWGMVIAPAKWGAFGGNLLVGNTRDGHINAFDLKTGVFRGNLRTSSGRDVAEPGLSGLAFGNGTIGTPRTLLFTAGLNDFNNGLLGALTPLG